MAEIHPQTPFGYVLFCDDAREDTTGKFIYTGVYTGNMQVASATPVTLGKICLVINYFERPNESEHPVHVSIFFPENPPEEAGQTFVMPREQFRSVEAGNAEDLEDQMIRMTAVVEISPFHVVRSGSLKVRIRRGDDTLTLGGLNIRLAGPPSAD